MTEPVHSPRALNRAVLARQLLLERADLPSERVLERVAGLQTQYAPSGYLGMWSRVVDFRRNALTDSLAAGRVIQGWVMRCTIHMVSAADYPALTEAVRMPRRAWWLRADKRAAELDMEAVADAVRRYLAHGPLKQFRDESGGELLDVPDGALPPADTPAPVRFLPTWDATLLVHARRAQILPEQYRGRVFATSMPQSVPTFLIDGQVAGTWRYVDGGIDLAAFHDLPTTVRRELDVPGSCRRACRGGAGLAARRAGVPGRG